MGSFMGFSCSHSSTVALVQNLHTGYISPQYQVLFDDKFKTVFNDRKTPEEMDKLVETLFAENHECYVEEEFNQDGVLVYEPPPLDEVWLTEPERRDRSSSVEKQRRRTKKRQRECISDNAKDSADREHDRCPPLIEIDNSDSDSKSQPDQEADFGSGVNTT